MRVSGPPSMIRNPFLWIFVLWSTVRAFAWTDGELLIWVNRDKGYHGLVELGDEFQKDLRVPVRVDTPDNLTDKFQSAAQGGKGPDIVLWAHDRIGEWADAGFLRPIQIKDELRQNFIPMCLEAVTYNNQIWG